MRIRAKYLAVLRTLWMPWLAAGLLACLWLAQPTLLWAQDAPQGETGCSCHSAETEVFAQSPHALAGSEHSGLPGVTCEDCHGPYVRGHPDDGVMALTVDSDVCSACHTTTFDQWQHSVHAESGVQCIGCHMSHSQTLRLSDEKLCLSCHRDATADSFHFSHRLGEIGCTDCHLAPAGPTTVQSLSAETVVTIPAPNHDFVHVSGDTCLYCHRGNIGNAPVATSLNTSEMTPVKLVAMADRVPELTAKLETAEKENHSLATISLLALAVGIGVGGVMGMIFVLVVGYVTQRRAKV
jgi:hypothetical protein